MKIRGFALISLFCLCLCCLVTGLYTTINSVQAYSVQGTSKDTYSFSSASESSSDYGSNAGGVQDENKAYKTNGIEIYYDRKTTSTNNVSVYEAVSKVVVSTNGLPSWSGFIWGSHSVESGTCYIQVYKDGVWKEDLSQGLKDNSSATFDLSGLNDKYDNYTFSVRWDYKIDWSNWPNSGKKYIRCQSSNFYVNTENISAYLTKTVYDVNKEVYTDSIENGGIYKTDNKNLNYKWNYTTYDNSTDTVNVLGAVYTQSGDTIQEFIRDGAKGVAFNNLANGTYILKLKTEVGKSCEFTLIIEPFDPLLNIESGVRRENIYCIEYESKISWTDIASVKNVKLNGFEINNGDTIKPGSYNISWGVEYKIIVTRTTDATEEYTFVFTNKEQVDLNANQNSLTKSPIGRWYETYLSENTEEKTYNSWASYDNALQFAIERENSTVTTAYYDGNTWTAGIGMDDPINRKEGNYFVYKKRDNSAEKNAYFTREALDSSILAYAKSSISNNTYFSKSVPAEPHQGEKVFKTIQEGDSEYNLFLLGEFTLSKRPYVDLWINGVKQDFGVNQDLTIKTPGTYKIEEINPFGDTACYFIYIQKTAPLVEYFMKGTSVANTLTNENTRFGTYFDLTLFDLDDDSLLVIEKKGISSDKVVYTYAELLEIKNQTKLETNFLFNQSGQYTIYTVNHWTAFAHIPQNTYTFYVSVNEPFINDPTVDREKNELTLSWGVPVGESATQVTSVVIQKYNEASETWDKLSVDSKGTPISPEVNTYVFNTKGYYKITITDNFARTYERDYSFSREKPSATLTVGTSEVVELDEDGVGYFNKKVTITWYDSTITAKMYGVSYTWVDGVMVKQNLNALEYSSGTPLTAEGYYIIELMDIDFNSRRFTFFIDQKAPSMKLYASDKEFSSGEYKNTDVKTEASANSEYETPITINVKKDTFPISYPENGIFTEEGSYEITLIDGAGNSISYSFTIDKTPPAGQLFLEDGTEFAQNGITNKRVYCSWVEEGVTATCNEDVYYKGALLENRNNDTKTYRIVLTDKAGNTSVYNFSISQDIPIIVMKTESGKIIANNTTIEEAFTISWEDPNYTYTIEILKNGKAIPYSNYTELSSRMFKFIESGAYRFTFKGGNGNTYIYQLNANMRPSAIISAGVEYLSPYDYTNKNVLVTISDRNATVEVFSLDENNDYKTYTNWHLDGFTFTLTEDGSYKIVITNDFEQLNNYYFTIKTSLPEASIKDENGNALDTTKEYFGTVHIEYNAEEVEEYKLYRNGEIVYGDNTTVSEAGRYTIILTDKAGNQNSYTFTLTASKDINWAGIVTLIVLVLALIGVAVFLILKFRRPFRLK